MCVDDGCDECLCCLCAPLAAIFLCKACKNQMNSNDVCDAPTSAYQQPGNSVPAVGVYGPQGYGPRPQNQVLFYPGGPQPAQANFYPPQQGYFQQQPRP